jgi:hypothetical protein
MDTTFQNRRRFELHILKHSNPSRLIFIYRHYAGLDEFQQLPPSISFTTMIEKHDGIVPPLL